VWAHKLETGPKALSDGLWHPSDVVKRATTKTRHMGARIPQGLR
jgi:hypothetical protein